MLYQPVVVDLETFPMDDAASFVDLDITAPANYKDADKIASYIADAQRKQVEKAALYPWTARIVALGAWMPGEDAPRVRTCLDESGEAEALRRFWGHVWRQDNGSVLPLLTFSGLGFDLPVLAARSRLLGVQAPHLNLDRYRSPHPDLLQLLTFKGAIQARPLTWFARRFGLPVTDETTGADIGALVKAGDWEAVRAHCESDVRLTRGLAERMGLMASLPTPTPEAVV